MIVELCGLAAPILTFGTILAGMTLSSEHADNEDMRSPLQSFVDRHVLAGAVTLVADKDGVLGVETVGYEDVNSGKPMAPNTLFWIASQTKPITATAFMILVDQGEVSLDDPVEKYLSEFCELWVISQRGENLMTLKKPKHPVTVREILSHTAGFPFASALEQPTLDMLPLRVAVRSYAISPLVNEPGTAYLYSNEGINIAGRIIEFVTGCKYEDFLSNQLLKPLGMDATTFIPSKEQVSRLARSYKPNSSNDGIEETIISQLKYPLTDPVRQPVPAGGLFSTAEDISKFCRMILNEGQFNGRRYLSREAVEMMTRKQTPNSIPDGYGLGWAVGDGWCGHGGAHFTNMMVDKAKGFVKILMVQHAGFPGDGGECWNVFIQHADQRYGKQN